MQHVVLDIKSKNHYDDFENIRELYGRHYLKRQNKKYSVINLFFSDKKMVKHLDKLEEKNVDVIEKIINDTNNYISKLKKLKLRSWLLENPKFNWLSLGLNKIILLLGLPVFLFGFIFNVIPFVVIDKITRKKIKDIGFWSTFFLVLGLILFPVFYVIEFFAVSWMIPELWQKLLFLATLPFAGKLAFLWYILFRKTVGRARLLFINVFNKKKYQTLLDEKHGLYGQLDTLIPV